VKVLTIDQMQKADQNCIRLGTPADTLMENAGKGVAEKVREILGTIDKRRVIILIGPGNNGGDGLVVARHLHHWGAKVSVFLCSKRSSDDSNLKLVQEQKVDCFDVTQPENLDRLDELLPSVDAVVDSLFGTGRSRPLTGVFIQVLDRVSAAKKGRSDLRIIAVDLPSGLNADTGAVDPACLHADYTVTLAFPKLGLFCFPGAERVGELSIVDISIPAHLVEQVITELLTDDWAKSVLPQRPLGANKGTFGRVLVAAGSINYIGAAYLACSGAMRVGAGLVTLATAAGLLPILASKLTEVTYLPLPEIRSGIISSTAARLIHQQLSQYNAMLIGCGLGQSLSATRFIKNALFKSNQSLPSLVLDADALNILAKIPGWWHQLTDNAILTPHPGEMARLAGMSVEDVQSDRVGVAKEAAVRWHKTVVLKGAYTVVATPDGRALISPVANPGLASAGTGDVLAGAIAGLVAQGLPLAAAAALGVYLHGQAGRMVKAKLGDAGMIASDLLPALPLVIKQLKENNAVSH